MSHPIHPIIIHFPIVFWTTATGIDLLSLRLGDHMAEISGMLLVLGIITAVIAMFVGLNELDKIKEESPAKPVVNKHMIFALLTSFLYSSSLFMRMEGTTFVNPDLIALCLSIAGFICLCITGFLGGTLVYKFGIGVEERIDKIKGLWPL